MIKQSLHQTSHLNTRGGDERKVQYRWPLSTQSVCKITKKTFRAYSENKECDLLDPHLIKK